ncbi:histone-lysine N-methyltransferase SETMAR [Nephila pilipes]|uniref:Histone-lysine N-methyltransferase SETMAR n=1 Tax=Nephila pilipes TaxID=299642 RepID=A0A8X6TQK9_NEPPI|nr:histone-lysine N-methyltransferase SETMAR [Nephila pilipes]
MEVSKDLIRRCLLYGFKVGLSEAASCRTICLVFGDSAVNERTASHWFQKFRLGSLSVCDEPRSGRPHILDDEALQWAIEEDSSLTYRERAKQFNVSNKTLRLHMHRLLTHLTLRHPITTPSTPWTIISEENVSPKKQTCAEHSRTSLCPNPPSLTTRELHSWRHVAKKVLDADGEYSED